MKNILQNQISQFCFVFFLRFYSLLSTVISDFVLLVSFLRYYDFVSIIFRSTQCTSGIGRFYSSISRLLNEFDKYYTIYLYILLLVKLWFQKPWNEEHVLTISRNS